MTLFSTRIFVSCFCVLTTSLLLVLVPFHSQAQIVQQTTESPLDCLERAMDNYMASEAAGLYSYNRCKQRAEVERARNSQSIGQAAEAGTSADVLQQAIRLANQKYRDAIKKCDEEKAARDQEREERFNQAVADCERR